MSDYARELPNSYFPLQGVLCISQQQFGSALKNIKSKKRLSQVQLQDHVVSMLSQGRTPYVVTSATPGPAAYNLQPDFAFVPPLSSSPEKKVNSDDLTILHAEQSGEEGAYDDDDDEGWSEESGESSDEEEPGFSAEEMMGSKSWTKEELQTMYTRPEYLEKATFFF